MTGRTAFLSYSHDSDLHRQRVARLSERLRRDGFETILDQYRADGAPPQGWGPWAMREIDRASHVLCICTAGYRERFFREAPDDIGRGVWFEAQQIITLLYESKSMPSKWIGAAVFSGADREHIPPALGRTFVLDSEEGYRNLYDAMLGQTGLEPGSIGDVITRPRATLPPARFGPAPDGATMPEAAGPVGGEAPPGAAELRSLERLGRKYREALIHAVQRIDTAQVAGEGKTKSVALRELYISLVAEPTSFEERQKAREIDAEVTRQAQYPPGDWRDVLLRPSESGFDRRIDADEIAGDVKRPSLSRDPVRDSVTGAADDTSGPGESLHDVVRRERCCVILGDPGSGKSVLCRSALAAWRDEHRGQTVLAMARMFAAIALKPGTDARLRREIQHQLRERASDPDSHRRLFRLQGVGGDQQHRFEIVAERFLDEELRVLELELLTQPPSGS